MEQNIRIAFFRIAFHVCRSCKHNGLFLCWKKGSKLLHHIRYKCFNILGFFFIFHKSFHANQQYRKKIKPIFMSGSGFCITCEHRLFSVCTLHCYINNRITIGLSDCCYKMNEHFFFLTNAGNKYYFTRFIDNFIKKNFIRYIKRLIFYRFLIDMTGENRKWWIAFNLSYIYH